MSLVMCTLPEARGSILRDCNHLWRPPHREQGRIKAPFAGTICLTSFLQPLLFEHGREAHSPECVEGEFCELRLYGVLRSSIEDLHPFSFQHFLVTYRAPTSV